MFFKKHRREHLANPSAALNPITMQSSGDKYVFCHFMMGNTYPYTPDTFSQDIQAAQKAGIDGFALNVGQDDWTSSRIATFFSASLRYPTFKLFFSFDMSIITSAQTIVNYVLQYKDHPNSFRHEGKYFMSTFAGESQSFGHASANEGWDTEVMGNLRRRGVEVCFVPSFSGVDAWGMYNQFPVVDGAFSWAAWPFPDRDTPEKYDAAYLQTGKERGKIYMASVSPCFFTHFPWKNWVYPDFSLLVRRFQELVKLQPDLIEIISWNDWGESHYIGPLHREAGIPAGAEKWITGYNHEPWQEICKYFIQAYKCRRTPEIEEDKVIIWHPPHLNCHDQHCNTDPLGCPANAQLVQSKLVAVTFMKDGDNQIVLESGGRSQTFQVSSGFNMVEMDLSAGCQKVRVTRRGKDILHAQGPMDVTSLPKDIWNYNLMVTKGEKC